MFTHQPTTPLHIEILIEFLRGNGNRSFTSQQIHDAFQPSSVHKEQQQSKYTLAAAKELGLIEEMTEENGKVVQLTPAAKGRKTPRECLMDALDVSVLASTEVEKYFAFYYAFLLGLKMDAAVMTPEDQVHRFNRAVFDDVKQENPFNPTKRGSLYRWFLYAGLGWHDPQGDFCCNPYQRVGRKLKPIFGDAKKLPVEKFMGNLATHCPELDGGKIFLHANRKSDATSRQCTLGLAQALVELHQDKRIVLDCPKDSGGWSIALADPPIGGAIEADRISYVSLGKGMKS